MHLTVTVIPSMGSQYDRPKGHMKALDRGGSVMSLDIQVLYRSTWST